MVIGGGNAAIDSARTALRLGASVTVVYRRERKDMPAIEEETLAAEEEGARFVFLSAPHRIIGDAKGNVKALEVVKTRLGEYDRSGRRKPILTDEVQRIECDSVIVAVGETVDLDFAKASGLQSQRGHRHYRGEPLHPGNQPSALLCRRRPGDRSLQRVECHGLRQAGGPGHRRATNGRQALGHAVLADGLRAVATQGTEREPASSFPYPAAGVNAPLPSMKWSIGLSAEETHEECGRCLRCDATTTVAR